MRTTRKNFNIKAISADKAYLSEDNIEIAFEGAAEPFILFKVDSSVGATFNMIKAKFRDHVRSRSDTAMSCWWDGSRSGPTRKQN